MSKSISTVIDRVADDLDIGREIADRAVEIAEMIISEDLMFYQSYGGFDALTVFSVYAASRDQMNEVDPATLVDYFKRSDNHTVSDHLRPNKVRWAYKKICRETDLDYAFETVENKLDKVDRSELSDQCEAYFDAIIDKYDYEYSGARPSSLVAASLYIASALADGTDRMTQNDIMELFDVSSTSINKTKKKIVSELSATDDSGVRVTSPQFSAARLGLQDVGDRS